MAVSQTRKLETLATKLANSVLFAFNAHILQQLREEVAQLKEILKDKAKK